ncbi:hypothetical protein F4810DRAFT_708935 [Camillea tinctor]|nr:hypothetical protein F4810DRAFT_708935 [Camillea tinctor]
MASSTIRLESPQKQRTMSLDVSIAPRETDHEAVSPPRADLASSFPRLSTCTSTTLHRLYIANKAELTRHVSAAAGAQEYLWGGDDWFVRWYEAGSLSTVDDDNSYRCSSHNNNNHINNNGGGGGGGSSSVEDDEIPGFDADSHNLAEHQVLPWPVISSAVDMVISRFEQKPRAQRPRRFSWVVGPMEQPQLETALRNRGLSLEEDEPAMVVDLESCAALDAKTETLPLSPQDAARFRLRDYQMQLLRLEQLNRKRLQPEAGSDHPRRRPQHSSLGFLSAPQAPASAWPETMKPLRDGFEIRPVTDPEGVADWVRAWAHEAAPARSSPGVRHWTRVYSTLLARLPAAQFQMFAAFRPSSPSAAYSSSPASSTFSSSSSSPDSASKNRRAGNGRNSRKRPPPHVDDDPENGNYSGNNPVLGTGYVHMYEGTAAIHCIVVRPEFRGRGIGRELARRGMRIARERGYRVAVVTGTPSSLGIFRALGFRDLGRVRLYVWRPPPPAREEDGNGNSGNGGLDKGKRGKAAKGLEEARGEGWEWVE